MPSTVWILVHALDVHKRLSALTNVHDGGAEMLRSCEYESDPAERNSEPTTLIIKHL